VDSRAEAGAVLVTADQIRSYDWATHTITLAPKVQGELSAKLFQTRRIVGGAPFAIHVSGKPIYAGNFTSIVSSASMATPAIVLDLQVVDSKLAADRLRIQLGYPTAEFFKGEDPRSDPRLKAALDATGKLTKAAADHTEWIAASLREMQTIKPGMTRADLLKVFVEEGGLSTRTWRRYAYRDCPYIQVDVTFEPVGDLEDKARQAPQDKISKISTPFLEWTIAD
jgi:hypothetical protein